MENFHSKHNTVSRTRHGAAAHLGGRWCSCDWAVLGRPAWAVRGVVVRAPGCAITPALALRIVCGLFGCVRGLAGAICPWGTLACTLKEVAPHIRIMLATCTNSGKVPLFILREVNLSTETHSCYAPEKHTTFMGTFRSYYAPIRSIEASIRLKLDAHPGL